MHTIIPVHLLFFFFLVVVVFTQAHLCRLHTQNPSHCISNCAKTLYHESRLVLILDILVK